MNDTLPLLAAVAVLAIVYGLRDGVLIWRLIHALVGAAPTRAHPGAAGGTAPPADPGAGVDTGPGPAGGGAVPIPIPASPKPRFIGITGTSFAGGNDSVTSRTGAYDGKIIDGDHELAAALPARFPGKPPILRVFYKGRSVDVPVRDVGPWNGITKASYDFYWETGARPQAETGTDLTGRKTNHAGIDLSPAVWAALGYEGNPRDATAKVDWDFVDALGGAAPAPTPAPSAPPWLVLMRKLRDMGVHAEHDSPIILAWPIAIANKFPDMADYCKNYQHDSTPWCGLTVAYVMAMSGIRPVFGASDTEQFLWADAWRAFGTAVDTPQPGDVMVFKWSGGGEHVTLYDHEEDDAYYHCTGGNQGNSHVVSTEAMPMGNCIAIRRPPSIAAGVA